MTEARTLGQELRALRERSNWSQKMVADLANLSVQTIHGVEKVDANWSSAVAYATALGRKLVIDTSRRNRKMTAAMIAKTMGMSVNTVIRVMAICADPSRLDVDCHLANLDRYLSAVGGAVVVRR